MALSIDELRKQSFQKAEQRTQYENQLKQRIASAGNVLQNPVENLAPSDSFQLASSNFPQSVKPSYTRPSAAQNFLYPMMDTLPETFARTEAQNALQGMNSRKAAHQKDMQQQKTSRLEDELKLKQQQAAGFARAGMQEQAKKAREEAAQLERQLSDLNHVSALQEGADFEQRQYYEMMAAGGTPLVEEFTNRYIQLRDNVDKASVTNPGIENNGAWEAAKDEYNQWYSDMVSRYGEETVDRWMEYGQRIHNQKATEEYNRTLSEAAKADKVGTSILSVPLNLTSGLGYLDVAGQKAKNLFTGKDYPVDYNTQAQRNAQAASNIRGAVSEDMSGVGSFLYNTGMSMLDSATMLATGNVGAVLLGGAAATNSMHEAVQRGASTNQALAIGLVSGLAESVMEKASIDKLFGQQNAKTVKEALWNVARQAGAEGTEEGLTNLVNTIADGIIMGDRSQIETMISNYVANGYSEREATAMAISEWAKNLGLDILGGAISGGLFSGAKMGFDALTGKYNNTAPTQNTPSEAATPPVTEVVANEQRTMDDDIAAAMADMKTPEQRIAEDLGDMGADGTVTPTERQPVKVTPVRKTTASVNPENVGDMGAMTNKFRNEVKENQTHALDMQEELGDVPEEHRQRHSHDVISEKESLYNARLRVEQDFDGEKSHLSNTLQWTGEDADTAFLIRNELEAKAKAEDTESAWDEYNAWCGVLEEHGTRGGQALQAFAKWARNTGSKILQRAGATLNGTNIREGTDKKAVMNTISDYASRYDTAKETRDVDSLVQIIKDTSATRKTGSLRHNALSKQMNWALDRIANYAKTELSDTTQTPGENYRIGKYYDFLADFAASGIEAIATDKQKTDIGEAVTTIQRQGMLSKAATVLRNLVNNGLLDPLDTLSSNVSAVIDSVLYGITGTRSVAFEKFTSKEKKQGSLDGLAMAMLSVGLDVNSEGVSGKYQDKSNRTWHMANGTFSKLMSLWEKYMGYAMVATDEYKKGGIRAEVQRGIDKLYEQNKIADDSLRNAGDDVAKYRTLQKEGRISKFVTNTRKGINDISRDLTGKITRGKVELDAGNLAVPFAQVPANVPGVIADYSPIGVAKGLIKLANTIIDAKERKLTAAQQASAVRDIGRGITGSVFLAALAALAKTGVIHMVAPGGTEEDKNKSADEKASGLNGTQWNLSATLRVLQGKNGGWQQGDKLMSIGFLEPINAFLTTAALLADDTKDISFTNASFTALLDAYLQLPMFETLKSAVNAFQYSDEDTFGGKFGDAAGQFGANLVSGFIPNAVKGIAQGLDPYQRDLYSGDTFGERVRDQFRGVFNRDALPIKQDVYGNDMKNENRFLNFMNSNILPGAITTYKETDLQKALRDLEEETGATAVYLSKNAPTSVSTERGNVELTDEQKKQFTTDRGNIYEMASSALENSDLFKGLPESIQQKTYGYAEDYATQTAKENLGIGFKPDTIAADLDNPTSQELLDALLLKTFNSMAGDKKQYGDKYEGYADLLRSDTINDKIALDLISATRREVYENTLRGSGVSVQQWLDVLGAANRKQGNYVGEKPTKQQREDAWAKIDKMNLTDKQRAALENAVGQVFGYVIVKDATRK